MSFPADPKPDPGTASGAEKISRAGPESLFGLLWADHTLAQGPSPITLIRADFPRFWHTTWPIP